jgi:protoporphyrinogen oxidase
VWGTACEDIGAEWGAQRIKGLNVTKALTNAVKSLVRGKGKTDLAQKQTETSLIEQFLYPKLGPGQMWEEVAKKVKELGGEIVTNQNVARVHVKDGRVASVDAVDSKTGAERTFKGDVFFSTMPIKELVRSLDVPVPAPMKEISEGLLYRDFITVGLLLKELKIKEGEGPGQRLIKDNWIYVQEADVQVGRLQIFNNWSPYMVADPKTVWIGLEYFCNEGDALWSRDQDSMIALAKEELERIDIIDASNVLDAVVLKQPKTYPAYIWSAATGCTSTTTRTSRCSPP